PGSAGHLTGSMQLTTNSLNAASSSLNLVLSGTGAVGVAQASLRPSTLTFGKQNVGTTSAARTITLSNADTAAVAITSTAVTGSDASDFSQTNTCGSSVAAGASCAISVTFTPGMVGARSASIAVTDNVTGSPQPAALSGSAVGVAQASL